METCFVLVKGIKCPAHCTPHWYRTEQHIGTLAPSNAALAKKGKWSPISKRLFDQIKVVTKGWQSFAEKKQNSSISPPLVSRHCHCPQNCKKEISSSTQKVLQQREESMEQEWVRWVGISHSQYQTLGACSLAENGHCGTNPQCKPGYHLDMRRPAMAS